MSSQRIAPLNSTQAVALPVQDLEVQVITTDSSWDEFRTGCAETPGEKSKKNTLKTKMSPENWWLVQM